MHIATLYGSTYSQDRPITGHIDVSTDGQTIKIQFTPEECLELQDICVKAYLRVQSELAKKILNETPALTALPPPAPELPEAEFTEVEASDDLSV